MTDVKNGTKYIDKNPPMETDQNLPRKIIDYLAYLKESLNFVFATNGRRLTDVNGNVSEINRTAEELSSTVSNLEGDVSTISQKADRIDLVVDSNDNIRAAEIVAAINDAGSTVKISADHVAISGFVTFTNLATADGTTVINGGNITTGYISADRIQAGTITIGKLDQATQTTISTAASDAAAAASAASSAQSTANGANLQEQLIYISKASGTTSVSATTTWITNTTGNQNTWTLKRPQYNSSYPVLFVATQRKTVAGNVTCTTPMIDETTTVIDGGRIITGSITANQISAGTITLNKLDQSTQNTISTASSNASTALSTANSASTAASTAQSTANGANGREQTIYISKASGTTSVTANTTWVTSSTDSQNAWRTRRPTYSSSYPVVFVAVQRQTVAQMANSGTTCTCTTPVIDNTTTVIDGGSIVTGSLTANKIAANETFTQKLYAQDFNITGGSISVGTNTETDDVIQLNCSTGGFSYFSRIKPNGFHHELSSGSNFTITGDYTERVVLTDTWVGGDGSTNQNIGIFDSASVEIKHRGPGMASAKTSLSLGWNTGLVFYDQSGNITAEYPTTGATSITGSTDNLSATTSYKYSGVSVTIPANKAFVFRASAWTYNANPAGVAITTSSSSISASTVEAEQLVGTAGYQATAVWSGKTSSSTTYYIWAKGASSGRIGVSVSGFYI